MDINDKFDNNGNIITNQINRDIYNTNYEIINDTNYYLMELVDKNKLYFSNAFNLIDNSLSKVNWCAFFFGLPYIIYRKMFKRYIISASIPIGIYALSYILGGWFISNILGFNFVVVARTYGSVYTVTSTLFYIGFVSVVIFNIYVGITFNKRYYMYISSLIKDKDLSAEDMIMFKKYTGVSIYRLLSYITVLITPVIIVMALAIAIISSIMNFFG